MTNRPQRPPGGHDRADTPAATLAEQAAAALTVSEDVVDVLAEVVQRLAAVEKVLADPSAPGAGPGTRSDYRFELYPDADTEANQTAQLSRARKAWERLDEWVTWLTATYRLTTVIPPCWADHTALREELIGLLIAWSGAWSPQATHEAIVIWHEKLWNARGRLLDGNWGRARCDGTHDDSGLDLADSHRSWAGAPRRDQALIAARDRSLAILRENWSTTGGNH